MQLEEWRPVPGFESLYSVSSLGRVRSERREVVYVTNKKQTVRERIMSQAKKKSGHCSVMFYGAQRKRLHVHRLVLFAFVGEPPTPLHEAAHNDGDPSNNTLENLRWATRASNHADKVAHGTHNRGERHPNSKLTNAQAEAIRQDPRLCKAIASEYGITFQTVWQIKAGKSRKTS